MTDNYPFLPLQPEAHKLNADEHSKMCKHLHNYIIMLRKFVDPSKKTGWSQSFNFLQKLYAKSDNPMPITPLALCVMNVTDSLLLHVLKHLAREQERMKEKKETAHPTRNFPQTQVLCHKW
jgi:hypothetical protein